MYEDEMVERVSDDEGQDDDAMQEDENHTSGHARPRTGREVPDDEPPLDGYERYVAQILSYLVEDSCKK